MRTDDRTDNSVYDEQVVLSKFRADEYQLANKILKNRMKQLYMLETVIVSNGFLYKLAELRSRIAKYSV